MPVRRLLAALVLGAALLLLLIGRGGEEPRPPAAAGGVTTLADPPVAVPTAPAPPAHDVGWRAREQRRLKRSRTVAGALRRAWLARRIDGRTYTGYRGTWARAQAAARKLDGARGTEQRAVVRLTGELAGSRSLTSSRLPQLFLTLRRNTNFWTRRGPPRAGQRFAFGRDPVVFRYYPGQGLLVHWLGTWGRANARARFCLTTPARCPTRTVRWELDRLAGLASRRAGYAAYEGLARVGGGPNWVSGMTQGTAVQALARGRRAFDAPRLGLAARRALGAFEQPPPRGIAVPADGGHHYLMYSFAPGLRILNGDLQAVTGLHDGAALTGSKRAKRLYRSGERAARRAVAGYDTGAWSLYSAGGRESTLGYHRLVDGFLGDLCRRTKRSAYCRTARRFSRYEREPTRIAFAGRTRTRLGKTAPIRFSISKASTVVVEVRGFKGLALHRVLQLPRGAHEVGWKPARRGRYRVRVLAQGPSGPRGERVRSIRVTVPPKRSKRPKPER